MASVLIEPELTGPRAQRPLIQGATGRKRKRFRDYNLAEALRAAQTTWLRLSRGPGLIFADAKLIFKVVLSMN
jgi:hypothetical protein